MLKKLRQNASKKKSSTPGKKEGFPLILKDAKTESLDSVFCLGGILGTGGFSVVKECERRSGGNSQYAAKVMKKKAITPELAEMLVQEVAILKTMQHAHIIHMEDVYESERHIYIILERVNGGELFDRIVNVGSFEEDAAARIVAQLMDAVGHIHTMNVIHRDLKPENLLCTSNSNNCNIKIADFGLAAICNPPITQTCGTPGYVAPEVLKELPAGYSYPVDVWSCGVITYILLCGYPPFFAEDTNDLLDSIIDGVYDFPSPEWDTISEVAKQFVCDCLTVEPEKRLTAETALLHPWVEASAAKSSRKRGAAKLKPIYGP